MKQNPLIPRGAGGCFFSVIGALMALGLTLATVRHQRPSSAFCGGRLSAGFQAAFVCDATGESPLSSVG